MLRHFFQVIPGVYVPNGEMMDKIICPHLDESPHTFKNGLDCVRISFGFCQVGQNCYAECEYAWFENTDRANEAHVAWALESDIQKGYLAARLVGFMKTRKTQKE